MADAATQQIVDQVVQERVQAGAMFTAYDITLLVRGRGGNVRHNDVRDLVHEFFEQGRMGADYGRALVDVGAPTKPFLYHRIADDPRSYRAPGTTGPSATPTPAAQPTGFVRRFVNRLLGGNPAANPPTPSAPTSVSRPAPTQSSPPARTPRPSTTLLLDAEQFLPISRTDLLQAAKGVQLWGSVWFGRRDLIPPISDPRTALIDRGMVTQGLLTPEQLAELHAVGAEMDRVRPDLAAVQHQAQQAGQAAVESDRAERAKVKAEKKAEAAAKRERRADEVAQRRLTDIVFLGRGVSGRLGERTSDQEKLTRLHLPVLSSPAELAHALGLTIPRLRWLAFHTEVADRTHYVQFTVPKKSGGLRTLSAPHRGLAAAQRWILREILAKLPVETPAHGFIPQRSILTNARQHVGREVVINLDLESFFPSITFPRVRSVFFRLGYSPAVATILALLCTECPRRTVVYAGRTLYVATGSRGLPQGACTSPALSNQVAQRLDKRCAGLAKKMNMAYTRYADDLTLSGHAELKERVGYVLARVRHIAQDEGFQVNEKKTRVQRRNAAQSVTGLVVNDSPGVPRAEVRRIRAILHRAKSQGLDAQNRQGHPNFRAWLAGKIAYIGMARPKLGRELKQSLQELLKTA